MIEKRVGMTIIHGWKTHQARESLHLDRSTQREAVHECKVNGFCNFSLSVYAYVSVCFLARKRDEWIKSEEGNNGVCM